VELLSDPLWAAQPVSVVAQRCGFLDHSQFSRAFRQHTGTTPRSFRA
jgi:AraC-like DNA-binding protein